MAAAAGRLVLVNDLVREPSRPAGWRGSARTCYRGRPWSMSMARARWPGRSRSPRPDDLAPRAGPGRRDCRAALALPVPADVGATMTIDATLTLADGGAAAVAGRRRWGGSGRALAARELARRGAGSIAGGPRGLSAGKVCGCCLNACALATLAEVGLGELAAKQRAVPLHQVLRRRRRRAGAQLDLPGGAALSRARVRRCPGRRGQSPPGPPFCREPGPRWAADGAGRPGADRRGTAPRRSSAPIWSWRPTALAGSSSPDRGPIAARPARGIGAGAGVTAEAPEFYRRGLRVHGVRLGRLRRPGAAGGRPARRRRRLRSGGGASGRRTGPSRRRDPPRGRLAAGARASRSAVEGHAGPDAPADRGPGRTSPGRWAMRPATLSPSPARESPGRWRRPSPWPRSPTACGRPLGSPRSRGLDGPAPPHRRQAAGDVPRGRRGVAIPAPCAWLSM